MMQTTLKALSEHNRLRIVGFLIDGPHAVGEIVLELDISQPLVSKHLRVLSEAGLVEVHQAAQQRIYTLRAKPFKELDSWLESYRRLWGERFDRLDNILAEEKKKISRRVQNEN